jgi:hypothetical protein
VSTGLLLCGAVASLRPPFCFAVGEKRTPPAMQIKLILEEESRRRGLE